MSSSFWLLRSLQPASLPTSCIRQASSACIRRRSPPSASALASKWSHWRRSGLGASWRSRGCRFRYEASKARLSEETLLVLASFCSNRSTNCWKIHSNSRASICKWKFAARWWPSSSAYLCPLRSPVAPCREQSERQVCRPIDLQEWPSRVSWSRTSSSDVFGCWRLSTWQWRWWSFCSYQTFEGPRTRNSEWQCRLARSNPGRNAQWSKRRSAHHFSNNLLSVFWLRRSDTLWRGSASSCRWWSCLVLVSKVTGRCRSCYCWNGWSPSTRENDWTWQACLRERCARPRTRCQSWSCLQCRSSPRRITWPSLSSQWIRSSFDSPFCLTCN